MERDLIRRLAINKAKPSATRNLTHAELAQLIITILAGNPDTELVKRLAIDAKKPSELQDLSPNEMADLVLVILDYIRKLSHAIKRPDLVADGIVPGLVPQPDVDYPSIDSIKAALERIAEETKQSLAEEIEKLSSSISNGKDGRDGKDGAPGKPGRDGKDGKDGRDAIITEQHIAQAAQIAAGLIKVPDFPTLITQSPESVRNGLELLQGDDRLSITAIKGIDELVASLSDKVKVVGGGGNRTIKWMHDITNTGTAAAGTVLTKNADGTYSFLPSSVGSVGFSDLTGNPTDNAALAAALAAKADAAATTSALAAKVSKAGDSMSGALVIAGSSNTTQLKVTGHSTQTANVFELYNQLYGSPIFAVANNGTTYARSRVTGTDGSITLTTGANPTVDIRGDISNGYYPGINFYWAGGTLTGSITGYNGLALSAAPGFSAGVWSYYQNTPAWYVKSGYAGVHTVPLFAVRGYQAGTAHPFNVNQDGAVRQHGATASWNKSLAKRTSVAASVSGSGSSFAGGITYYYKVTACNFVGETIGSAEVSATPAAGQNVNLTWGYVNMDGVDHVRVYRSTTAGSYGASSRVDTGLYTTGIGVPYYTASFTDTGYTPTAGTPPTAITHDIMTYRIWEGQTGKVIDVENYDGTTLAQWKADGNIEVPTEAFGAGWASSSEVPTKGDTYTALQDKQDVLGGAVLPTAVNAADTSNRIIIQDPNASGNVATILVSDLPSGGGGVSFAQALAIGYLNL